MRRRTVLLSLAAALLIVGAASFVRLQGTNELPGSDDSGSGNSSCASTNLPPGVSTQALEVADPCYRFEGYKIANPLSFCVDPSGRTLEQPLLGYVENALDGWKTATGLNLPATISGTCSGVPPTTSSGRNVIGWGPLPGEEVGYTTVKYRHGIAEEAVVSLEASAERLPESCLDAVLLHEFGHVLGLQHQADADSIMQPVTDCPDQPSLSARDIAAVQLLYGSSGG